VITGRVGEDRGLLNHRKLIDYLGNETTDGNYPESSLIIDGRGNLYGTTIFSGTNFFGTMFELSLTIN
jgi:hypothetical protein